MRILFFLSIGLLVLVVAFIFVILIVLAPADRSLLFSRAKTVSTSGTDRHYHLLNGSKDAARPLIIGLHGFRDMSRWLGVYSGMNVLAENENITLALPSGRRQSWNGGFCCGWASQNNVDDVTFISEMIDDIKKEHAIDDSRIYVVGFSNGGILAQRLLADRPDLFAAGASLMSGVSDRSTTLDIERAQAPLLLVNGTRDNYVPVEDSSDTKIFNFSSAKETARIWAEHYQLTDPITTETPDYQESTWVSGDEQQLAQRIYDSSHRWPQWRLWDLPNRTPASTQAMWEFLSQHQLEE